MTPLEYLLLIFVVVETVQVFFLLRNNIKMKNLIAEIITNEEYAATVAKNMVFGFMEDVVKDKDKAEVFFGFVASCGVNAAQGIKEYFGGQGQAQGIKLKRSSPIKPLEGVLNQLLPGVIEQIKKKGAAKAEEVVTEAYGV